MVTASLVGVETVEVLDTFATLPDALAKVRETWQEDTGHWPTVIRDEDGNVLATMLPVTMTGWERAGADRLDWEIEDLQRLCLTVYPDGRTERHRCEYVLDADGMYLSTTVTPA